MGRPASRQRFVARERTRCVAASPFVLQYLLTSGILLLVQSWIVCLHGYAEPLAPAASPSTPMGLRAVAKLRLPMASEFGAGEYVPPPASSSGYHEGGAL
ncbi:hypothetical protein MCEMIE4_03728 [Sphingobium cupriresistens]